MADELTRWEVALQQALRENAPDASIRRTDSFIEVLVWDETAAAATWNAAEELSIPDAVVRVIRPIPFLRPYPGEDKRNEEAQREFFRNNVRLGEGEQHVLLSSFEPLVGACPKVLVLGSMPGAKSLELGEYYAHPRNRFWWVVENLYGIPATLTYGEKAERLTYEGIALWDVLRHCTRVGSLDRDIASSTEVPNDLETLLGVYSSICRVVLNGRKAERSFRKFVSVAGLEDRGVSVRVAPSTSPANAAIRAPALLDEWRSLLLVGNRFT